MSHNTVIQSKTTIWQRYVRLRVCMQAYVRMHACVLIRERAYVRVCVHIYLESFVLD